MPAEGSQAVGDREIGVLETCKAEAVGDWRKAETQTCWEGEGWGAWGCSLTLSKRKSDGRGLHFSFSILVSSVFCLGD